MPTTKLFELEYSIQGKTTIYGIILQRSTGYYLKSSSGAFASAPADRFNATTEHGVLKGIYQFSEARLVWDSDEYVCAFYDKVGASEDPSIDTFLGVDRKTISGDVETTAPVDASAWQGSAVTAP